MKRRIKNKSVMIPEIMNGLVLSEVNFFPLRFFSYLSLTCNRQYVHLKFGELTTMLIKVSLLNFFFPDFFFVRQKEYK